MSKAIFVKLNFFPKKTVNNLKNLTWTLYSQLLPKKKKRDFYSFLQSVFCYFLYYLHYFNVWCKTDKIAYNLPETYLNFNNGMKESREIYMA